MIACNKTKYSTTKYSVAKAQAHRTGLNLFFDSQLFVYIFVCDLTCEYYHIAKMCGILCEICYADSSCIYDEKDLLHRIRHRGPDCTNTIKIDNDDYKAYFHGSVLWMQGHQLTPQPVETKSGILLFNGDIFDNTWRSDVGDTQTIIDKLSDIPEGKREDHIIKVLRSLTGPFALIYFDRRSCSLYFTRDRIGRSSLLFYQENNNRIVVSSVLGRDCEGCLEVPAEYIFSLNIKEKLINIYSWNSYLGPDIFHLDDWLKTQTLQQSIPDDNFHFNFDKNMDLSDSDNLKDFIETTAKATSNGYTVMKNLMAHDKIRQVVLKVTELLEESVYIRVKRQPQICKSCVKKNTTKQCNHCTLGVLFSGGLDCTILALLADKFLPKNQKIDLINVAFKKDDKSTFNVPDRLTGRQSYKELMKLCPKRIWEFKEVNVPKEELEEYQSSTIADLIYPRKTILDESLGSALWFAARGKDSDSTTPCRVLLLGSGADELFGGYTRHRNAYKRNDWTGLAKELMLDWKRISIRNLSRDNRVICDHGRQPRMPYLDENFTEYVLQLKPWLKCFPSEELGPGIGDKLMLRLVALHLGLTEVVSFPKRAMQFGSRIANKKEKGADISKTFMKLHCTNDVNQ